jgi:hypothetical protein
MNIWKYNTPRLTPWLQYVSLIVEAESEKTDTLKTHVSRDAVAAI